MCIYMVCMIVPVQCRFHFVRKRFDCLFVCLFFLYGFTLSSFYGFIYELDDEAKRKRSTVEIRRQSEEMSIFFCLEFSHSSFLCLVHFVSNRVLSVGLLDLFSLLFRASSETKIDKIEIEMQQK